MTDQGQQVAAKSNGKQPQQPEKPGETAEGRRLRLPLNSLRDVQRELARLYRGMKADQLTLVKGRTLVYALSQLSRSIEGGEIEKRIVALELQLALSRSKGETNGR